MMRAIEDIKQDIKLQEKRFLIWLLLVVMMMR